MPPEPSVFRFFIHLPSTTSLCLRKLSRKSVVWNDLPISLTRSGFCPRSASQVLCFEDFPNNRESGYRSALAIRETISCLRLAAPARAAAAHAPVTASIAGHDGSADRAAGGVAHVDQLFQCVSGMVMASDHATGCSNARTAEQRRFMRAKGVPRLGHRSALARDDTRRWCDIVGVVRRAYRSDAAHVLRAQAVEERLLLAGEEAQLQPAEDVIHDRLGVADVGIVAPAAGLEAGVRELFAQQLERNAVLQGDGDGAGKAVHQATDGRAFLGHGDEQLARHSVLVEADGEVAFVSADLEFVRDGKALVGQTMTHGARRLDGLIDGFFRRTLCVNTGRKG